MERLNSILESVDALHPLQKHSDWIKRVWVCIRLEGSHTIPSPTSDQSSQALSVFCMIRYISAVRNWRLFEGAIEMAASSNSFSLAQIVRASFENAGWLGHACHLTKSWPPATSVETLKNLLTGTRVEGDELQSISILTCLKNTDRVLRDALPEFDLGDWIQDFYGLVSESVHPNADSNFSEIEFLEKPEPQLRISPAYTRESVDALLAQLKFAGFVHEQLCRIAAERIAISI